MENRLVRRHMCHGHSLFPAYKGSQRAVVYDARSSSLDRRQHGSYNWWLSSGFDPADAAAPHTGSECAQSDSAYGHVLACHGLCRKRPCELYRSAAFRLVVVSGCGKRRRRCPRLYDGFAQCSGKHTTVFPDRGGHDNGGVARHL